MTLIVCVDDRLGMAFNHRRQSRDLAVCQDIVRLAAGSSIGMEKGSEKLFEGLGASILSGAEGKKSPFYFLELSPPSEMEPDAERIILYRWNRRYPADLYFDISLANWRKLEAFELSGRSHELITREVYICER